MSEHTRREFLQYGGSLALLGNSDFAQIDATEGADTPEVYGLILDTSRPSAERINQDWDTYRFVHLNPTNGKKAYITHETQQWRTIPGMSNPETQVDEVRVEDYTSFFDHTFARPGAPDSKNWLFNDADVTKFDSEVELAATAMLETSQHGNYPPGTESIAGGAFRLTGTPTAGYGQAGYYNSENGFGGGEDATDSYFFLRKNSTDYTVYRSDWNGYVPDSRVWVNDQPVITRFPHLFYGGGSIRCRALIHENNTTKVRTLHTFTPENTPGDWAVGPPFDQPNLPFTFESSSLSGGAVRANAAHYERGESNAETRVNGQHFDGVSVASGVWTPIMVYKKRADWEMVNVQPLKVAVTTASEDVDLELQLDPTLSGVTYTLPEHTSSSETAVEVDTNEGGGISIDSTGERRWTGIAVAGQANKGGSVSQSELEFNLPNDMPVVLAGRGVGGSATVSGTLGWQEFF